MEERAQKLPPKDQSIASISPASTESNASRSHTLALLAMLVASIMFALMGASTKWAARPIAGYTRLPGAELAFVRYLFGVLFLFGLQRFKAIDLLGNDRKGLFWRGLSGGIASTLYFLGIQHTSLTNATLLNSTFVIWAPLIATFALQEPLGRRGIVAVLIAMGGVTLVTNPHFGTVHIGDAFALLSGILAGTAVVQIRRLRQGEGSYAIFFYFNLIGLPVSFFASRLTGEHFILPAPIQILPILAVGITSVGGQLLMNYAYGELTTAQGSLINLTAILYAAFFAHFLFYEAFSSQVLVGGVLILIAASMLAFRKPKASSE